MAGQKTMVVGPLLTVVPNQFIVSHLRSPLTVPAGAPCFLAVTPGIPLATDCLSMICGNGTELHGPSAPLMVRPREDGARWLTTVCAPSASFFAGQAMDLGNGTATNGARSTSPLPARWSPNMGRWPTIVSGT